MLGADLVGETPLGDAVSAVMSLPAAKKLPPGVEIKQFGDAEIMAEVFQSFEQAMGAGLMMVYAVLVLLFSSFMLPVTILFSLPFSIGGAIVALALTAKPVSLPVVIGILMLMGIVTKNAIMLADFAVEEMRRGVPRNEAIIDAGRKRARPIVMTTIAMVGGMLPSALALDSGGEFRAPMAIAVIGGLVSSTVLGLIFVPAFIALDRRYRERHLVDLWPLRRPLRRGATGRARSNSSGRGAARCWPSRPLYPPPIAAE